MRANHVYLSKHEHKGKVYHFEWKCGFMGTVDYLVSDDSGTYRAELRGSLGDYERSISNYDSDGLAKHVESAIGILKRCVCDNQGEIARDTIDAFNAWRASEHARQMAFMRAHPDRYGTEFNEPWFQPPLPVSAGRWTSESGWQRVA